MSEIKITRQGRDLLPGDRIVRDGHATSAITHLTVPWQAERPKNRRDLPAKGDRVAWADTTCLGPVPARAEFTILRDDIYVLDVAS